MAGLRRVMHELRQFGKAHGALSADGIGLSNDPNCTGNADDVTSLHALVIGPADSPYSGGFFQYSVRIPVDYPAKPPNVKILTTDGGTVRFNPNFYSGGKVCLDILNNHANEAWSAGMNVNAVLVSIQSIMVDDPYHNEPGFEDCRVKDLRRLPPGTAAPSSAASRDVAFTSLVQRLPPNEPCVRYAAKITHEVLRHAVCDAMEGKAAAVPALWREAAVRRFLADVATHVTRCETLSRRWDGQQFAVERFEGPENRTVGTFNFGAIRRRLLELEAAFAPTAPVSRPPTRAKVVAEVAEEPGAAAAAAAEEEDAQENDATAFAFRGPPVATIDETVMQCLEELQTDPATREGYELLLGGIAFALMDDPIVEPLAESALGPRGSGPNRLATVLGWQRSDASPDDLLHLQPTVANRDAFEITQALFADALE